MVPTAAVAAACDTATEVDRAAGFEATDTLSQTGLTVMVATAVAELALLRHIKQHEAETKTEKCLGQAIYPPLLLTLWLLLPVQLHEPSPEPWQNCRAGR